MVEIDRGVPAKRVDIVYRDLTKPDSYFEVSDLGRGLAVFSRLREGRVVCEDGLQVAQRQHSEGRPGHHARCVDDDRARRAGCDREFQHRGRQDLREPAARCEDGDDGLHAGRQTGRQRGVRRHRLGDHACGADHRPLRLFQL